MFLPVTVRGAEGVRAGDDEQVLVVLVARVDGRADSCFCIRPRDDLLAGGVTTPLGPGLVLDVDRGDAGVDILANRSLDVVYPAVPGVGVGLDENVRGFRDAFGGVDHLRHSHRPVEVAVLTEVSQKAADGDDV